MVVFIPLQVLVHRSFVDIVVVERLTLVSLCLAMLSIRILLTILAQ